MADQNPTPTHVEHEEIVRRLYAQVNASRAIDTVIGVTARFLQCDKRFESPLEHLFAATWVMDDHLSDFLGKPYSLCLVPQRSVVVNDQNYRPDFVVFGRHTDIPSTINTLWQVAIELDGHDFHERTKQQVAYRNRRDRAFQAAGWKVFHFSGSEAWKDPVACVNEVKAHCHRELDREFSDYVKASSGKGE